MEGLLQQDTGYITRYALADHGTTPLSHQNLHFAEIGKSGSVSSSGVGFRSGYALATFSCLELFELQFKREWH
jgi:hypothetical protein